MSLTFSKSTKLQQWIFLQWDKNANDFQLKLKSYLDKLKISPSIFYMWRIYEGTKKAFLTLYKEPHIKVLDPPWQFLVFYVNKRSKSFQKE